MSNVLGQEGIATAITDVVNSTKFDIGIIETPHQRAMDQIHSLPGSENSLTPGREYIDTRTGNRLGVYRPTTEISEGKTVIKHIFKLNNNDLASLDITILDNPFNYVVPTSDYAGYLGYLKTYKDQISNALESFDSAARKVLDDLCSRSQGLLVHFLQRSRLNAFNAKSRLNAILGNTKDTEAYDYMAKPIQSAVDKYRERLAASMLRMGRSLNDSQIHVNEVYKLIRPDNSVTLLVVRSRITSYSNGSFEVFSGGRNIMCNRNDVIVPVNEFTRMEEQVEKLVISTYPRLIASLKSEFTKRILGQVIEKE